MKRLALATVMALAMIAAPTAVLAGQPSDVACWGSVSSQFAQSEPGALGDHASSFDSPRLGIGNVAYINTGTHQPGVLGAFLGGLLSISC